MCGSLQVTVIKDQTLTHLPPGMAGDLSSSY